MPGTHEIAARAVEVSEPVISTLAGAVQPESPCTNALPKESTATQRLGDAHETDVGR